MLKIAQLTTMKFRRGYFLSNLGRFYRPIALYYYSILVGLEKLALNKDIGYTFENIKSKEDNYIVKIMCWDSMTKLIPLNNCEVATVQQ